MVKIGFQATTHQIVWLFSVFGIFFVIASALLFPCLAVEESSGNSNTVTAYVLLQMQDSDTQYKGDTVYIGVWLINVYSFQYQTGDYTLDFYLYFFWVDSNITQIDWQLVNGYPITPTSVTLIDRNLSGEIKHEIYRVTARCNTPPDAKDYPFDTVNLELIFDLIAHNQYNNAVWLENETGIDVGFKNAGWNTISLELLVSQHPYPLDVVIPRAEMVVTQQRQRPLSSFQAFIPPVIFGIVSTFSFLFNLKEMGAVGLRIGLNTSMLVTTLLFAFTAGSNVPPASTMTIYSLFMLSVLIFMVINVNVTIVGIVAWGRYKNETLVKRINRWGFFVALILPAILFILVYFVRT
ncbi:MAG: hypothetical protein ACQCN5_13105 [Candidatus Bathyarchaeia archaeon]|jgi:hypothetical protein